MRYKSLGNSKLKVSALGLGCMGMSEYYGPATEEDASATLLKAYELGINFFDTANIYGQGHNEKLLGRVFQGIREKIIIATKCGIVRKSDEPDYRGLNGSPAYIQASCEASLKRLNTECIDLFYLHRLDPATPIEVSVEAMAQLIKQGKVRYIGLSEVDVDILRRAHAVHPITALQSEYSLWTRSPEKIVIPACQELNIGFVPYSPIGRGFFSGKLTDTKSLAQDDFRRKLPRFEEKNMQANLKLLRGISEIATLKGCTPAQLALAWVLAQGEHIVPIPGTKRQRYLEENVAALDVVLTEQDLQAIDGIATSDAVKGERYAANMQAHQRKGYE